ncbi:serine/threonine protein kinase [Arthrobacter globiformis NBRC 12137]|uniref:non-specific serine/threonine protein kinase n=1 Tax=Arthrobacter globiformis (strain ATCC 8010 / DSM 20124 / JCM 1332 / NBRC 12137 / NCIMB 8907 / NRRL B-2979 / 168) TaxID=1077972 RepID=H0QMA3_ARTG1|nr:PASTA domain-containing protein [Arthrobacter globiformis]GAB13954.1 serine/threonine protein kinase [Arthrobacter globiformis NBRC 12137]
MQENALGSLVGSLVDNRYQVKSRLARGGMSTVYVATDQRLDRDVALKVLHPHLVNDGSFLDRLAREARAAAKLSHPHVVGVLDQGHDGDTAYLVMEYIKGHTLRDVINSKGALSPRLALALIDPVVEGLGAAHAAGLIHRDVKPENVLIADDGRIKIGDFGLARAVTTTTSTGALIGTVAYLSPELVLGKPADARSDIYSTGIMLFEMLTGRQPFDGDVPIQVAYQHVNSAVGAPSGLVPGLAGEVDELVQWCTASDPEQRPVDGNALLAELRHIRTNLTDTELDLQPPAAIQAAASAGMAPGPGPRGMGAPPAPARMPSRMPQSPHAQGNQGGPGNQANHTELLAPIHGDDVPRGRPTEVISRTSNPTTVFSAPASPPPASSRPADSTPVSSTPVSSTHRPVLPPYGFDNDDDREAAPLPLSKREQRKLDRHEQKERSRAAATPVRTLREGNSRRRGALWIVVLVILALLATGAGWFFGMGPGSPGTVPAVANRTVAEAQQLLRDAGFQSSTKDVFDDDVKAGLVVGSEPDAGTEIRKFQQVSLFVSKGPQLFPLPQLTGKTLDASKEALNGAEMALGKVTEKFDEEVPAGTVLGQAPAPGTAVRHGTPVSLTVSKGPQPIPVPDVRGQDQDAAFRAIESAGLKAVFADETVHDRNVPKGAVVSQEPASGTLTKGQTVTLTISEGPKLVKVPNYIGKQVEDATEALRKRGFQVRVNEVLGGFFGTVRDQDPVDTEVPEGSVVTLTVV